MKNYKILLVIPLFFITFKVNAQSCYSLPKVFSSYEKAFSLITKAKFQFVDAVNTSKSSWIRSATFKSCDGKTGFLIIGTDSHPYIHQNVPISLWYSFKKASSFGRFYNQQIRNKYKTKLKS